MRRIADDPAFNRLLKSVKTKVIQELLLVWYNIFYDYANSPAAAKIMERARREHPHLNMTLGTLAWSLRPEDVSEILKISKRQAYEYVKFFRTIYTGM